MALSKERLEQLVARSSDVVVATEKTGTVALYNDGASKLLGYAASEILGVPVQKLYSSLDEAKRVMACMRSPEFGGVGVASSIQTTFVANDGTEIPVAITGTVLYDDDGKEDGTIGFAKDIREILAREELATLGEVAIGLSHEINNPLAVILNQAELLERDIEQLAGERDSSVENERLDAMRREIGRIAGILDRLTDMAQADHYDTAEYIGPAKMIDLSERRPERGPADPRMQGMRILVVDDDLGIARTMQELLEADGCSVTTANDGLEALDRLEEGDYEAILSDVVMPNMDGHELFLRCQEIRPGLPVLMMTAFHYDKDHIIKRSRVAGLQTVLFKKPVDPAKLREALLNAVYPAPKGS
jgi:PAS domain S-box-containing protein